MVALRTGRFSDIMLLACREPVSRNVRSLCAKCRRASYQGKPLVASVHCDIGRLYGRSVAEAAVMTHEVVMHDQQAEEGRIF